MIGQTISRYRIIAEGGMGVVYKAEDIKLGRFISPEAPQPTDAMIVATYVMMGEPAKARQALKEFLAYDGYVSPACLAYSYLALGEYAEGFEFLENAYEDKDFWLCVLRLVEVGAEARSHPRFIEMLKRLNLDE